MKRVRSALAAPFRLAPVDLLAAISIAVIASSLIAGPVLSQDASFSPAPSATPQASRPAASLVAQPSSLAEGSPAAIPTSAPTLVPGQSSIEDPCAAPSPWPTLAPGVTPGPGATHAPKHNLCPAQPGSDPISLLAWVFTPIFQVIFLGLAILYSVTGDIGTSIILLTIIIRIFLIPVFRAQIVSQKRMQMLQPELRAIQTKYKGDRAKISSEQMQLYKERGVNPASGCLPAVLQLVLLLPMYQVFNQGLNAPDISHMLTIPILNVPISDVLPISAIQCQVPGDGAGVGADPYVACINPNIPWLAWIPKIDDGAFLFPGYPGGLPSNQPEIFVIVFMGFGLSLMAATSALLQLVQTRMMMTRSDDPQQRTQQRIFLLLPAFSLIYGAVLPAGLFVYWITTTVFSIVQQFLINGYGGLFPIRGWTPGFAVDHKPRFPVTLPEPRPPDPDKDGADSTTKSTKRSKKESAAGTIRPARRRSRRRGRRR